MLLRNFQCKNRIWDLIAFTLIALVSFLFNSWYLNPHLTFFADDWGWLHSSFSNQWSSYFSLIPIRIYNDRPVGALLVKIFFELFSLNYFAFAVCLLSLHAINCALIYLITSRYLSKVAALLAALLSATWISANNAIGWTAAIFDLLGATMCMLSLLFKQMANRTEKRVWFDLLGVSFYILAIRTKEFSIGLIALFVLIDLLLEKIDLKVSLKRLIPYFLVFLFYATYYFYLYLGVVIPEGDPYSLQMSIPGVMTNLYIYVKSLFYEQVFGNWILASFLLGVFICIFLCSGYLRRVYFFAVSAFVILLGPTLLLAKHVDPLYLYAPHFFMAMSIAALWGDYMLSRVLVSLVSLVLFIWPVNSQYVKNIVQFSIDKRGSCFVQFEEAKRLLDSTPKGARVFISGVEPFFNPFNFGPGSSLKVFLKDNSLQVSVEKPDADLRREFCNSQEPKRFISYNGLKGQDLTREVAEQCI